MDVILPKTSVYVKRYNGQTKWMYFLIKDNDLLEKYKTVWDKISSNIKKFDSKPSYNNIFLKTKIKSNGDKATDFHDKDILKVDSNLAVITLKSALNKDKNYYLQVLLKECKYIEKEKKGLENLRMIWGIFLILMSLMKNKLFISHLSFIRKGHGVFLNHLYDFKL